MQQFANESIGETPLSVSSTAAQLVASNDPVSSVVVPSALGLGSLGIFGVLLISPGCGQPT
jgi:hypothetical protein